MEYIKLKDLSSHSSAREDEFRDVTEPIDKENTKPMLACLMLEQAVERISEAFRILLTTKQDEGTDQTAQQLVQEPKVKYTKRFGKKKYAKLVEDKHVPQQATGNRTSYGTANEQLSLIGRHIATIPADGNCMFKAIARQVVDPQFRDHKVLRQLAVFSGREQSGVYQPFLRGGMRRYQASLDALAVDRAWNLEIGDMAIRLLQVALDEKIVVIRSHQAPQHFPEDGCAIDEATIVIVKDDLQEHYDATAIDAHPAGRNMDFGTAIRQLAGVGRVIDQVTNDANSMFVAIARQLDIPTLNPKLLRRLAYKTAKDEPSKYSSLAKKEYLEDLKILRQEEGWNSNVAALVLQTLADKLGKKFMVIRDGHRPQKIPDTLWPITDADIVLVQDDANPLTYSGSARGKPLARSKHENIYDQLQAIGREIEIMPTEDYYCSLFNSISYQLPREAPTGPQLRTIAIAGGEKIANRYLQASTYGLAPRILVEFQEMRKYEQLWNPEMRDVILSILQKALNVKIVVMQSYREPIHFPSDGQPINNDTIVIVQDDHLVSLCHSTVLSIDTLESGHSMLRR